MSDVESFTDVVLLNVPDLKEKNWTNLGK